jgi:hypothetical protein
MMIHPVCVCTGSSGPSVPWTRFEAVTMVAAASKLPCEQGGGDQHTPWVAPWQESSEDCSDWARCSAASADMLVLLSVARARCSAASADIRELVAGPKLDPWA